MTQDPLEPLKELGDYICEVLEGRVEGYTFAKDELVVTAKPDHISKVLQVLRDDTECQFQMLCDITAVDYPNKPERFQVVYNLLSLRQNMRIRVKCSTNEHTPVPSVVEIFSCANWYEREIWDMYGILFTGHPDLRRILTDYGFEGHPLRKEFPLTGFVEVRYDEEQARVVYEPVELQQDFRNFDFESPWEGMTDMQLPGDEKARIPAHGYRDVKKETAK